MNKRVFGPALSIGVASIMFGAAAMAQSSSEAMVSVSSLAQATATTVVTSTAVVTNTAVPTGTVGVVPTTVVSNTLYVPGGTGGFPFADPAFLRVWDRTDHPVQVGQVSRTWFWGPGTNTPGLTEAYEQGPAGRHLVQYFDKSRMEINDPAGDRINPFFVTNGLLTVDLISGNVQVGDAQFSSYYPACIAMSGD